METRRDYHIQVDVKNVGEEGDDLHQRMIESWAMAFLAVGIPFLFPAARMQTIEGTDQTYHQLIYGVSGANPPPEASRICQAVCESLAIHNFQGAQVDVTVYCVHRDVVSSDRSAPLPMKHGRPVLAA